MNQSTSHLNTSALLEPVVHIAQQAAAQILEIYGTDFSVQDKDDQSPLTAADMASHEVICHGLSSLTPDIPILSEESAEIPYDIRRQWHRYWLVDPLDGTREFVKRNGEFTVNIALIEEHRSILGVVQVPVSGLCYFAARDQGAYLQTPNQSAQRIKIKKTSPGTFTVAGSRSHGSEQQAKFIATLGQDTELIAIGSSLKFCLVAAGKVDIYPRFGPTSEWDTAAAQCVVEEAGGMVTDTALQPLLYNSKESLLNPHFIVIADKDFNWRDYLEKI